MVLRPNTGIALLPFISRLVVLLRCNRLLLFIFADRTVDICFRMAIPLSLPVPLPNLPLAPPLLIPQYHLQFPNLQLPLMQFLHHLLNNLLTSRFMVRGLEHPLQFLYLFRLAHIYSREGVISLTKQLHLLFELVDEFGCFQDGLVL